MARIRSVHPGFFRSPHTDLRDSDQLLLLALGCQADDQGIFERDPHRLKMSCRPSSAESKGDIDQALHRIEDAGAIRCFKVGNRVYGAIGNFAIHQRPLHPKKVHPCPPALFAYLGFNSDGKPPKVRAEKALRDIEQAEMAAPIRREYPSFDAETFSDRSLKPAADNWKGNKTPYQGQNTFQEKTRREDLTAGRDCEQEFE